MGSHWTSHVTSWKSGLLSSCELHLGISLEWLQGNWASSGVDSGNSGSSPVMSVITGFLSSLKRGVRPRLDLRHGPPHFSLVVKCVSGLMLSWGEEIRLFRRCNREVRSPFVLWGDIQDSLHVGAWEQASSQFEGKLGILSTCGRNRGGSSRIQ